MEQSCYPVRAAGVQPEDTRITVTVPGSKSITNRALLLATLADGESLLTGALFSDDSRHFLSCVRELGFFAEADEQARTVRVRGCGGRIPKERASLYVGSAGTAARFLTAFLAMSRGEYDLDASPQMRRRPMKPLLDRLRELGARIDCAEEADHFPFRIVSRGAKKREVSVNIDSSSQFLSALLISACLSEDGMRIGVEGSHGMAYIDMTVAMLEEFGVRVRRTTEGGRLFYEIPAGSRCRAREYPIEPDLSAAAYFYALAAVLGIQVTVRDVSLACKQGDVEFLRILSRMGCRIRETKEGVALAGPKGGRLSGIRVNMSACSDQAITLAAIAPYADGPVTIEGIGHIRLQESDRLSAMETELTRMGVRCETTQDSITIWPGTPQPAKIHTYDDHRMAMGFALTGLRAPGIEILDPGCCRKTFENYFEVLDQVLAEVTAK